VSVLGIAIVGFLDDNSFLRRIQYDLQLDDLKTEIQKYNDQNKADSKQLRELKRDPKAIEKIARERYFMKADNEDIYVLSDDEQPAENQEDETTE
jgi:cell division protein FtsB